MNKLLWDTLVGAPDLIDQAVFGPGVDVTLAPDRDQLQAAIELALASGQADVLQNLFDAPPEYFAELDWASAMTLVRDHYPPHPDLMALVERQYDDLQMARAIWTGDRAQIMNVYWSGGPLGGFRAVLEAIRVERPDLIVLLVSLGAPYDDGLGTAIHQAHQQRSSRVTHFLLGLHGLAAAVGPELLVWILRSY